MNYSIILYVIGWVLNFEAAFMVPACVTGLIYREPETSALAAVALLCLAVGLLITKKKAEEHVTVCKGRFCDGCIVLGCLKCAWCASICDFPCDSVLC